MPRSLATLANESFRSMEVDTSAEETAWEEHGWALGGFDLASLLVAILVASGVVQLMN